MELITKLGPKDVFVFGSNRTGFHGAGSAGMAMRGTPDKNWRADPMFLKAMNARPGSPDRIGKWAVFGVARGFQQGREGMSYAIETIVRPGIKRSTPLSLIQKQLVDLLAFAQNHLDLNFLMTAVGTKMAGYTDNEMAACWKAACAIHVEKHGTMPKNLVVPDDLYVNWLTPKNP